MSSATRQQRLGTFLAQEGYASLEEIVRRFGVSTSTIRRDLSELQHRGLIRRTRGGALHAGSSDSALDYNKRESQNSSEKEMIGNAVAAFVCDGDAVILDGGTTTFQVAKCLRGRPIHVVTNSLPIAGLLGNSPETELVFLGGYVMPRGGVSVGPYAEEMLRSLHVRLAIMGTAGVTEEGFFNNHILVVELEKLMMSSAEEVIVAADHTKFGRKSLAKLCESSEVNLVVSDAKLERSWEDSLRTSGVDVHLAKSPQSPESESGAMQ